MFHASQDSAWSVSEPMDAAVGVPGRELAPEKYATGIRMEICVAGQPSPRLHRCDGLTLMCQLLASALLTARA